MLNHKISQIEDLNRIYESYASEFPVNERKSLDQLKCLMSGGKYHLVEFEDKGFAFVYADMEAINRRKKAFIWLDYLVIHKQYQGQGYGSIFFNQLLEVYRQADMMFIEVEIPDGIDINKDRRIRYYENLGCERLLLKYALPIENGALPMFLYTKGQLPDTTTVYEAIHEVFQYVHHDNALWNRIYEQIVRQSPNFGTEICEIFI